MRTLKKLVALAIAALLTCSSSVAQTTVDKQTAKIHSKLEKIFDDGDRAKVELKDGRKVQGAIAEIGAETFVLGNDGQSNRYSYSEVKKVGRFGPSRNAKKWVALGFLGGLLGLTFLMASQTD